MTSFYYRLVTVLLVITFCCTSVLVTPMVLASDDNAMELILGDLQTISVNGLTRISVTDPDIADISDAQADKVMLLGKKPGKTIVFLWDAAGKRSINVSVVREDLGMIKTRVHKILEKSGIKGITLDESSDEGKVVASGTLSAEDKTELDKDLEPYGDSVLNLVKVAVNEDLVQVDMQITELNTTMTQNLGVEWGTTNGDLALKYPETLPATNGKPEDFFKIGDFNRTSSLQATINAIVAHGKGRVLSKPRLVVLSGKEASFLVGGEIPIKSTSLSATGGVSTENVTFKQYGVNLTITPTVRNGKIDVLLNVEISDPIGGTSSGSDTAFTTRTAQTNLFLDNGQTIVLAGLIKHNDGENVKEVPFLGRIPIVGLLFRSRNSDPNSDTELVIILTPTILKDKKFADKQVVMPTAGERGLDKEIMGRYEQEPLRVGPNKPMTTTVTPTPVMNPPMPAAAMPGIISQPYAQMIQAKISNAISYPYEALQNNWQGTVKLKLRILRDGTLATSAVSESSGHDVFDQDALNTAKIVAPYPAFPGDMAGEDLMVVVPIVYSQESALSKAAALSQ